jgi:4-amino-4-deoxy-L-arabinose transferase-like glycosyltransferase
LFSPNTVPYASREHIREPLKILRSSTLIRGLRVWVTGLCRCGPWTMTASHSSASYWSTLIPLFTQTLSRNFTHQLQRNRSLPGMFYSVIVVKPCSCFI